MILSFDNDEQLRLNGANIDDGRTLRHMRNSQTSQIKHGNNIRFARAQHSIMTHVFDRCLLQREQE